MKQLKAYRQKALLVFFLTSFLFIVCCSKPLPQDKLSYSGYWEGKNVVLTIYTDGRIKYKRQKGYGHTKINAPIKEFNGNDFVVGIGFIHTTFKVDKPPYEENGTWKMVVDGVELTRY